MRRISAVLVGLVSVVACVVACGSDPPPQPVQPAPTFTAQQPQPAPVQTAPAPVAGQLATPGPTALACQNDSQCMTHKCNVQFGKCAFPCVSDFDCIQGSACAVAGGPLAACLPKVGGQ